LFRIPFVTCGKTLITQFRLAHFPSPVIWTAFIILQNAGGEAAQARRICRHRAEWSRLTIVNVNAPPADKVAGVLGSKAAYSCALAVT